MKRLLWVILICLAAYGQKLAAQSPLSYAELLENTPELSLSDSISFDNEPSNPVSLDSVTTKQWFSPILSSGANKFKNKSYSLLGKITSNDQYDLLILREEKKKNDTVTTRVTYLVSTHKNGDYIASLKAAVTGTKKKTEYNISSCLYKNNRIVLDSRIVTNAQSYKDMTYYRISEGGRFIIYPNN